MLQRACLQSKYSILQNIPKPKTRHDKDSCNMLLIDSVKNALSLGLNDALIRMSNCDEDMLKYKYNSMADRMGAQKEIKYLAKNAKIITTLFSRCYSQYFVTESYHRQVLL